MGSGSRSRAKLSAAAYLTQGIDHGLAEVGVGLLKILREVDNELVAFVVGFAGFANVHYPLQSLWGAVLDFVESLGDVANSLLADVS